MEETYRVQESQYSSFWNEPAKNERNVYLPVGMRNWVQDCGSSKPCPLYVSLSHCNRVDKKRVCACQVAPNDKVDRMSNDEKHDGANAAQ